MRALPFLIGFMLLPFMVQAADSRHNYSRQKLVYQSQVDKCDAINAREILELQTQTVSELKPQSKDIHKLFTQTRIARQACYKKADDRLADMIATGLAYLTAHDDDVAFHRQMELDMALKEMLQIRKRLSKRLLASMESDIDKAIEETTAEEENTFPQESNLTRALIRLDMDMVLETERRQLNLDELNLLNQPTISASEMARVKLNLAQHNLARTLMMFEDANTSSSKLFPITRMQTAFATASGQFSQIFAFAPGLKGIPPEIGHRIANLGDRALVMEMDIEGAVRDIRNGLFTEDRNNWLSELYEDMSQFAIDTRTTLAALTLHDNLMNMTPPPDELPARMVGPASFEPKKEKS